MLLVNVEESIAEMLPFFLDFDPVLRKENHAKDRSVVYTPLVDSIAGKIWQNLDRGGFLDQVPSADVISRVTHQAVEELSVRYRFSCGEVDLARQQIMAVLEGEGPLAPLYGDVNVTDIIISQFDQIQIVNSGSVRKTAIRFRSVSEYNYFLRKRLPDQSGWEGLVYEGVLSDSWGTKIKAVKERGGLTVTLSIPRLRGANLTDLLRNRTLSPGLAVWLSELILMRKANVLIVGPPRTGKTTLLQALLWLIAQDERLCILEVFNEMVALSGNHSFFAMDYSLDEIQQAVIGTINDRAIIGDMRNVFDRRLFVELSEIGMRGVLGTIVASSAEVAIEKMCCSLQDIASGVRAEDRIMRAIDVVVLMGLHEGRPCVMELYEYGNHKGLVKLLSMVPNERGKRLWCQHQESSYWLDALGERGTFLT
jgi:Flp pilus assembly CpaF family ATPase